MNEAFARKFFPGEYPVGQTLKRDDDNWQIVGVCRDIKYADIKSEVPPTVYLSFRQKPTGSAFFALRTVLPSLALATAARKAMAAIDPDIPLTDLSTQEQIRDGAISQQRTFAFLCSSLAALAVLLSCIGLYGLMAYHVSRRTGEIGVRMALGAQAADVARSILREALVLAGFGIAIGLPAAFAVTRLIHGQLYGVRPNDPATFAIGTVTLVAVAFGAAWLPARRAARVDPIVALRSE